MCVWDCMLKSIGIITTAAYPWLTGTAILALLRAYYLAQKDLNVTLYIPWVAPKDQVRIFGKGLCFASPKSQEAYIRDYLPGPDCPSLRIEFYPGNMSRISGRSCLFFNFPKASGPVTG